MRTAGTSSQSLSGHARFSISSRLGNCEHGARQAIRMRSHCACSGNDSQPFPPVRGLRRSPHFASMEKKGRKRLCLGVPGRLGWVISNPCFPLRQGGIMGEGESKPTPTASRKEILPKCV